jgi:SagB-type dehydrogenase family enzyme
MTNRDLEAAWNYHNATKHSHQSVRNDRHFLDWANEPLPFKIYPKLEAIALPRDVRPSDIPALEALAAPAVPSPGQAVPDLAVLSQLLYFSAGITKRVKYPGGESYFRAAACTGALYEIELYVVCGDLPGLAAGLYHFDAAEFALRRLRAGDYRAVLVAAAGREPSVVEAPVLLVCTGTYWRNAWKYQARTYRHFGWDNGTILANLLTMCSAQRLPARVVSGFVDADVNRLLDLDTQREVAFSLVAIGRTASMPPAPPGEITPLNLETVPLSKHEVDYPDMRAMHAASSLHSADEVMDWRSQRLAARPSAPSGRTYTLRPHGPEQTPRNSIERVIQRRGSSRKFTQKSITFTQLSTVLDRATRGIPADFLEPSGAGLNYLYLIVNAVDDLPAGAYIFHPARSELECLQEGSFRSEAYRLGLEQELPADATAQLEAGIFGGKLYLAAYAQRLGATGLTFYDDDVTDFFSPHAEGKSAIFMTALGKPARRRG